MNYLNGTEEQVFPQTVDNYPQVEEALICKNKF